MREAALSIGWDQSSMVESSAFYRVNRDRDCERSVEDSCRGGGGGAAARRGKCLVTDQLCSGVYPGGTNASLDEHKRCWVKDKAKASPQSVGPRLFKSKRRKEA